MLQIALSLPSGTDKLGGVRQDEVLERLTVDGDQRSDHMAVPSDESRLPGAGNLVDDPAGVPRQLADGHVRHEIGSRGLL